MARRPGKPAPHSTPPSAGKLRGRWWESSAQKVIVRPKPKPKPTEAEINRNIEERMRASRRLSGAAAGGALGSTGRIFQPRMYTVDNPKRDVWGGLQSGRNAPVKPKKRARST